MNSDALTAAKSRENKRSSGPKGFETALKRRRRTAEG